MEIKIRRSKVTDYVRMKEFDEFAGDRRMDMERGELFIADLGSIPCVGYLKLTSNEFFNKPLISLVNTHPDYRGKGIGAALIRSAVAQAGWHKVYSTTEESNTRMQSLFESIGFEKVGTICDFNFDGEAEWVYCYTVDGK
ncbi:GNAT family N-acetyltransferase [Photobacterium sp. MCCC 1A19761]|uniref:GNAT family N-acetyltransferase n=1 Tax=Photobacterium sp. MCCC 1A19761 TaxID=3115000 RepID=UPI00307FAE15